MGGGEVARYMKKYGPSRIGRVAFVSSVTPYLLKTDDNATGVDPAVFTGMLENLQKDRPDFLATFGKQFYGVGMLSHPVSQATLDWTFHLAMQGSQLATEACAHAFSHTDFRRDLIAISLPTLIIHGDKDQTVPIAASAEQTAKILPHAIFKVYEGSPHGLFITDKDRLTHDLATFATEGTVDP
jgi:pimeloyl-ACP methyl ester carboxylesterase